jgi:hypothetical protein
MKKAERASDHDPAAQFFGHLGGSIEIQCVCARFAIVWTQRAAPAAWIEGNVAKAIWPRLCSVHAHSLELRFLRHRRHRTGGSYFCQATGAFLKSWTLERLALSQAAVGRPCTVRHAFAIQRRRWKTLKVDAGTHMPAVERSSSLYFQGLNTASLSIHNWAYVMHLFQVGPQEAELE